MRLRFPITLALLIVVTIAPCLGCTHDSNCTFVPVLPAAGSVIPEGFGVNIDFTNPRAGEMRMLSEAGFRWVRMDLKWDVTEQEPGRYDFSTYDQLMAALESQGLRALFILDYGNPLYDNGAPPRTERTRQAFARWAVAAAKHFAGRNILWEVYNEPNHSLFWPPKPNPHEYVALALEVGRAFRAAVPDEKLIGPATSEIDFDFLESCFKAGLLEYWSAVSIHPYRRTNPETAAEDYCRLRELIKTYAPVEVQNPVRTGSGSDRASGTVQNPVRTGSGSDRASGTVQNPVGAGNSSGRVTAAKVIPIISSEWGYSAVWPGLNEERQGELLSRAWLTNVANGISLSIWYDWRDDGLNPSDPEHHFGTVFNTYHEGREPVYDPKPAYLAVKTLTTFLGGYRFEKRLEVGGAEDYVLAFRKGSEFRLAVWTTRATGRAVLVPLAAGQYRRIKHNGEDLGTLSGDQKGLAVNLTTAPVFLRPDN